MLAGMGGVSYHRLVAAVSEAGGFGCLGASTMGDDEMVERDRGRAGATASRSASTCSPPLPRDLEAQVGDIIDRRRHRLRRRARRAPRRRRPLPRQQRARREHVRQGPPRDRRGRGRAATSSSPRAPRPAATPARSPRWRWSPRSSTRSATACRWWPPAASSTGGAWPRRSPSAPTACGSAPGSSPRPRPAASPGYKDALLRSHEDGTVVTRAYTGKTCRVDRNDYTAVLGGAPTSCQPFPAQFMQSMQDGANHLGRRRATAEVDPDREFLPAGQGVGAIDELVPAGDLVHRFVAEAEAVLDRVAALASTSACDSGLPRRTEVRTSENRGVRRSRP